MQDSLNAKVYVHLMGILSIRKYMKILNSSPMNDQNIVILNDRNYKMFKLETSFENLNWGLNLRKKGKVQ